MTPTERLAQGKHLISALKKANKETRLEIARMRALRLEVDTVEWTDSFYGHQN